MIKTFSPKCGSQKGPGTLAQPLPANSFGITSQMRSIFEIIQSTNVLSCPGLRKQDLKPAYST